jgi:hypothetical protein
VIGGLITSTGLTLVIVPAVFTIVDDLERWVGRRFFAGGPAEAQSGLVSGPGSAPPARV